MIIQSEKNYDDIINLPHHVSSVHPPLSDSQRAAQFLPFPQNSSESRTGSAVKEKIYFTSFLHKGRSSSIFATMTFCSASGGRGSNKFCKVYGFNSV